MHALESSQSYSEKHDGAGVGAGVGAPVGGDVGSHKHAPETQCAEHSPPIHSSPVSGSWKHVPPSQTSAVHAFPSSHKLTVLTHRKSSVHMFVVHSLLSSQSMFWVHSCTAVVTTVVLVVGSGVGDNVVVVVAAVVVVVVGAGDGAGVGASVGGDVGSHKHAPETQCAEHSPPIHSSPVSGLLKHIPPSQKSAVQSFSSLHVMTGLKHV